MGATESLALLQRAKLVLFENKNMPEYVGKRREVVRQQKSDVRLQLLDELDKQFYKDPDGLGTKCVTYAKLHDLL